VRVSIRRFLKRADRVIIEDAGDHAGIAGPVYVQFGQASASSSASRPVMCSS